MLTQALLPPCALQPHREAMPMGLVPVSPDHRGTPKPCGAAVHTDPAPPPPEVLLFPTAYQGHHLPSFTLSPACFPFPFPWFFGRIGAFIWRQRDRPLIARGTCVPHSVLVARCPGPGPSSLDTPHTTSMSLPSPHPPQVSSRTLSHIPGLDTEGTNTKEMDSPQVPPLCP